MADVHQSLVDDGVKISLKRLQEFVHRLLHLIRVEQATRIGLNWDLLTIIRHRYKLPTEPRAGKTVAIKPDRKFDVRHRYRRQITLEPKTKQAAKPVVRPRPSHAPTKDQPLLTGVVSEPSREELAAFQKLSRFELAAVNKEAIRKIRAINRNMMTNIRGTCFDIRTWEDYSEDDLQRKFGLTYAEARSCFLTID